MILTLFVQEDTFEFCVRTLFYAITELLCTFSCLIPTIAKFPPFFFSETGRLKSATAVSRKFSAWFSVVPTIGVIYA